MNRYTPAGISCFVLLFFVFPRMTGAAVMSHADSLDKARKHLSFALQYKKIGKFDDAMENYMTSIACNDTVYQVHFSFADLLMKMDRRTEAKRQLLRTMALKPDHYKSASMLAGIYYGTADYDSSLVMYETMHRLRPGDNVVLESIASLSEFLGGKARALEAYSELIGRGENSPDKLLKAAELAMSLERYELAADYAGRTLSQRREDRPVIETFIRANRAAGHDDAVAEGLRLLAGLDGGSVTALTELEDFYRERQDFEELAEALEEHHRRAPADSTVIGELAELLLQQGRTDEGIALIREGLKAFPGDGKLHILLGDRHLKEGRREEALGEFRKALEDAKWKSSAQRFIWSIVPPETQAEKNEREFFNRGKDDEN